MVIPAIGYIIILITVIITNENYSATLTQAREWLTSSITRATFRSKLSFSGQTRPHQIIVWPQMLYG